MSKIQIGAIIKLHIHFIIEISAIAQASPAPILPTACENWSDSPKSAENQTES